MLARSSSLSQKLFQGHQRDSHTRSPCAVQLAAWTDGVKHGSGGRRVWRLSAIRLDGRRRRYRTPFLQAAASIIKTSQVCDPGRRYWRHVFHPCLSLLCTYLGKEKRRGSRFKIVRETGPMIGVTEGSTPQWRYGLATAEGDKFRIRTDEEAERDIARTSRAHSVGRCGDERRTNEMGNRMANSKTSKSRAPLPSASPPLVWSPNSAGWEAGRVRVASVEEGGDKAICSIILRVHWTQGGREQTRQSTSANGPNF